MIVALWMLMVAISFGSRGGQIDLLPTIATSATIIALTTVLFFFTIDRSPFVRYFVLVLGVSGSAGIGMLWTGATQEAWAFAMTFALFEIGGHAQRERRLGRRLAEARRCTVCALERMHSPCISSSFLLRAVNTIWAMMIDRRHDEGEEVAITLGNLLAGRTAQNSETVTLAAELALVRHYLAIEQICFDQRLIIDVFCSTDAGAASIPSGILQPIVEQAVALGVAKSTSRMILTIFARRVGRSLRIICRWEAARPVLAYERMDPSLQRVADQLNVIYGSRASMTLENVGHYSTVALTIKDGLLS